MKKQAQMCYTDESEGKHMLITTIDSNSQREQHIISMIKAVHLTEDVNLLEDGGGEYYISYKLSKKPRKKKVYMGWSKTPPVPAKPLYMKGFAANELEYEVKNGRKTSERLIRHYI